MPSLDEKLAHWFFKNCQFIFTISMYLPLQKGLTLYLTKYLPPYAKDVLCQICLKLVQYT